MKIDGSQEKSARFIADYIRRYMRYYDIKIFSDPFCGFANIYRELYKNIKKKDPNCMYHLSDYNPFLLAILERLWQGKDIPDVCDKERWKTLCKMLKHRFTYDENLFAEYEGYENWEVGAYLILGCYHQNIMKGYIGDEQYAKNVNQLKELIRQVPEPTSITCCDYMNSPVFSVPIPKLLYFDFPEPSAHNYFPFGMYFDRNEFFKFVEKWDNTDNIMMFSSKYYPDNGKYEILFESGEHKLYIGKRWYVEDIVDVTAGTFQKFSRPPRSISEASRRREGKKVPLCRRSGRSIRLEKKAELRREQEKKARKEARDKRKNNK